MRFWETYLQQTQDEELLRVCAPWFAWRALVLASPQWYPTISNQVRTSLLTFAREVLEERQFRWSDLNYYLVR
jgi:hypothetical protein